MLAAFALILAGYPIYAAAVLGGYVSGEACSFLRKAARRG